MCHFSSCQCEHVSVMFERCFQSLLCSSPTVTSMLRPSKLAGADPEVLGIVGSGITYSGIVLGFLCETSWAEQMAVAWQSQHGVTTVSRRAVL